eukprot:TRINITY_DN4235_c0_g1_i6.p1 TRINITY_DN4235_c0_g1~~TRINITY_DN4235_c0_g1_i6.p1  ORF type:complete len:202 (+),score=70.64 TRINITY_DN4235_c0_g1_i6:3-608(+)
MGSFFFLVIRGPPRSTQSRSSAASDVYKRQMQFRVNVLAHSSTMKLQQNMSKYGNNFDAWNASLQYYFKPLGLAYGDCYCAGEFERVINSTQDPSLKAIFIQMLQLWAFEIIEKDQHVFSQMNFLKEIHFKVIREKIQELCYSLSREAYKILDIIAIPDEILGAPIGLSNGEMYKNFMNVVRQAPGCYERPSWWKELKGLQ